MRWCNPCREHVNLHYQPAKWMQPMESPISFAQRGMNMVGSFLSQQDRGSSSLSASTTFPNCLRQNLSQRSRRNKWPIFSRKYNMQVCDPPRTSVRQRHTFFWAKLREWCQGLSINQFFTSVENSQANGQTDGTNRTILQHIKSRLGGSKCNWVDELCSISCSDIDRKISI